MRLRQIDRAHVIERLPVDDADAPRRLQKWRVDFGRDRRLARRLVLS